MNLKTKQAPLLCLSFNALGGSRTLTPMRHVALNHACLPVPAPALEQSNYNLVDSVVKLKTTAERRSNK